MIRITRARTIPEVLGTKGAAKRAEHVRDVEQDRTSYERGAKLEFDRDVYAHPTVKAALTAMQRDKCAFCESLPLHVSYGDVEHFRPKAAWCQSEEGLTRPGYYWLAYEWTNLLFSCQLCNQRHKRNHFALLDTTRRCRSPGDDLAAERPVFIDPSDPEDDDPEDHIGFHEHVAHPVSDSARGAQTVEALGLNRDALKRARREHLECLYAVYVVSKMPDNPEQLRMKDKLARMVADDALFASMCRTALARWER